MNYEYKYVKIKLKSGWFAKQPEHDYQQVIASHAEQGWRFVQIFAPAVHGPCSSAGYFELIFEKAKAN